MSCRPHPPVVRRPAPEAAPSRVVLEAESCVVCGSTDLREVKCKTICGNCGTILRSCADL